MRLIALCALVFLALTATSAIAGKVYKWADDRGFVHYTAYKPAAGIKFEIVDAPPPPPSDSRDLNKEYAEEIRAAGKKKSTAAGDAGNDDFNAQQCKTAKANLQTLKEKARIAYKNKEGKTVFLEESQKEAKMAETQKQIDYYCK